MSANDRKVGFSGLYTPEELMVRLKFFIGVCLTLTLMGIIFTILYSVIFVSQPLKSISPIDTKFFEVIIPVASFLCGILSGIMLNTSNSQALDAMKQTVTAFKDQSLAAGRVPEPIPAQNSPIAAQTKRAEPQLDPLSSPAPITVGFAGKAAPPPAPEPEL